MTVVTLVAAALAFLLGVFVLITGKMPPAWRGSPRWALVGMIFSFGVSFLAMFLSRLGPPEELDLLLVIPRVGGLAAAGAFVIAGRLLSKPDSR